MKLRSRNPLFTEVSGKDEKVLLYRKKVQLWPAELAKASPYPLRGINDILRYNITEYTRKMDNPSFPLSGTWEDEEYKPIEGKKVYHITFVIFSELPPTIIVNSPGSMCQTFSLEYTAKSRSVR